MSTHDYLFPDTPELRAHIAAALREDLGDIGDVTTDHVFAAEDTASATVFARQAGIMCGGPAFALVFALLDPRVRVEALIADGSRIANGDAVLRVEGPARAVLAGERTALNFLQRLSGIATLTRRYVDAAGPGLAVCDTRKTNPAWRVLDRYAVRCGGGTNHRFGLSDMAMVKDTHADACGGLAVALARLAPLRPQVPVAAEARTLDEVRIALEARVDLLMLDNMSDMQMAEAVALVAGRIPIEATGGITLERLPQIAKLGVNRVSVGALTHSARALDFSMKSKVRMAALP
jgi:nicotinate-nucleotide pyrophosphorylase (carboxylating)